MKAIKLYRMSYLIAVSLLLGCGIYSKKSQREQKSENSYKQYEEQRLFFHQKHMDSLSVFMYFWTDSLLSFRPDSGLTAKGGRLYVQQSRRTFAEEKLAADQQHTRTTETLDSVTRRDRRVFSLDALRIALVIFLVLLYLMWRVRKKIP